MDAARIAVHRFTNLPKRKNTNIAFAMCNGDINDVISRRIGAADEVIQIKAEERRLPEMKWIEKVGPLSRVRDVRVVHDENVVKMKWIVE